MKTDDPRLIISQVYSRWRDLLMMHCPAVWTDLELIPSQPGRKPATSKREQGNGKAMVQWWIMRTGTMPLSLSTTLPGPLVVSPMNDVVIPFSTRFRRLELILPLSQARPLLASEPGSFPLLEELVLMGHAGTQFSWPAAPDNSIGFPALRSVSLCFIHAAGDLTKIGFPWNQIGRLNLVGVGRMAMETGVELLRLCKGTLEDFAFRVANARATIVEDMRDAPKIELPALQSLKIWFTLDITVQILPSLLQLLNVPRLKKLFVGGAHMSWSHVAFQDLSHRSSCTVEVLDLHGLALNEEMHTSIRSMPSLKRLALTLNPTLAGNVADISWAPQLEYLGVSLQIGRYTFEISKGVLEGIKSRLELCARGPDTGKVESEPTLAPYPPSVPLREVEFWVSRGYERQFQTNHGKLLEEIEGLGCAASFGQLAPLL
ncbi:hypothetical protein AX16_008335 [Volvariella volvacea WC 439]|nr:hypothetical protein AX16_008335 [Volvariella volvacea WC 439]